MTSASPTEKSPFGFVERLGLVLSPFWQSQFYLRKNWKRLGVIGRKFPRLDYLLFGWSGRVLMEESVGIGVVSANSGPQGPCGSDDPRDRAFLENSTDRETFFGALSGIPGLGLEIGPLHRPICPRETHKVRYIDVFTTDQLRATYANDPHVPTEEIVEVDYVWKGEAYADLIGERFDYIVSSHNIEHTPCLVGFLRNLSGCLNLNGKVFLAIPDKRYCFDHFKPESSLADVLDAFFLTRTRPLPRHHLGMELLVTHNDSRRHWLGDHGRPSHFELVLEEMESGSRAVEGSPQGPTGQSTCRTQTDLIERLGVYYEREEYRDAHVWALTPLCFAEIMEFLRQTNLVPLKLVALHPTARNSHECYAVLKKI